MKKVFHTILFSVFTIVCMADSADPICRKVITTDDGNKIEVRLIGDENGYHWQSINTNECYMLGEDKVHYKKMAPTTIQERRKARLKDAAIKQKTLVNDTKELRGHQYVPVILVEFDDKDFEESHDEQFYAELLNGLGAKAQSEGLKAGSVKDYFLKQSNGQLNLTFDILGKVKLSRDYSYYGEDRDGKIDVNLGDLATEAIKAIPAGVDFSIYDWDNDGVVNQVVFIYAWYGQNVCFNLYANTVWPQKSNLEYYGIEPLSREGFLFNDFACAPELRMLKEDGTHATNGIGTICHEFSHCLGLPDMYDGYEKYYGTTVWDVMGGGNHNDSGLTPAGYTSLEKMLLGWQTPIALENEANIENVKPASENGGFYIIRNDNYPDEFYLLENRQQTGFDKGLPGHGMLILHVDYDEYAFSQNRVNSSTYPHPRCGIILADNDSTTSTAYDEYITKRQGDLYPCGNNDSLTNSSTPAAILYHRNIDGSLYMNKPIRNIRENEDGTMGFHFVGSTDKDSYLLFGEVVRLRYMTDSSIEIRARIKNNSGVMTYARPIGAYVYSNGKLQDPMAFEKYPLAPGEEHFYDFTLSGFEDDKDYVVKLFYYPDDTTLVWKQMSDSYKFVMNDRQNYILSVTDDHTITPLSPTSVFIDATIHNESYRPYQRPLGVYVYQNEVLQTPRAFIQAPYIGAYSDENCHFLIDGLEPNMEYDVKIFYYGNDETKYWSQCGGPYRLYINEDDFSAIKSNTGKNNSVLVFSVDGRYHGQFPNVNSRPNLQSGIYILKTSDGKVSKKISIVNN